MKINAPKASLVSYDWQPLLSKAGGCLLFFQSATGGPVAAQDVPAEVKVELKVEANAPVPPAPEAPPVVAAPPWLGIQMEQKSMVEYDEDEAPPPGIGVMFAVENSPAAKAGILQNDRILKIGEKEIADELDLRTTVRQHKPGETLELTIQRKTKTITLKVTLEAMPPDQMVLGAGFRQGKATPADVVQFFQAPTLTKTLRSQPDSVQLADGNRLTGTLTSLIGQDVSMKLDSGHEVVLDAAQLVRLRLGEAVETPKTTTTLSLMAGGSLEASDVQYANGNFSLTLGPGETTTLPATAVQSLQHEPTGTGVYYRATAADDGWDTIPHGSWLNEQGTWTSAQQRSGTLSKKFTQLPDGIEITFEVPTKEGLALRPMGVTLFAQRLGGNDFSGSPGMITIDFNGNSLNVTQFDGVNFANNLLSTSKSQVNITRGLPGQLRRKVAICTRRTTGKLLICVDDLPVASYDLPKVTPEDFAAGQCGRVIRFRANQGPASLHKLVIRNWLDEFAPNSDSTGAKLGIWHTENGYKQPDSLTSINTEHLSFAGMEPLSARKAYTIEFPPAASVIAPQPPKCWVELKNGSAFPADSVELKEGSALVKLPGREPWALPAKALRSAKFLNREILGLKAKTALDVLTMADGRKLQGTCKPSGEPGKVSLTISSARTPILLAESDIRGILFRAPAEPKPPTHQQVLKLPNGDWFPVDLLNLTAETAQFSTPFSPQLTLQTSQLGVLYPGAHAATVADTASGVNVWKSRPQDNEDEEMANEAAASSWSYHNGSYTQSEPAAPAGGGGYIRYSAGQASKGLHMPLPEMKAPTLVEFDLVSQDGWAQLSFTSPTGNQLFSVYYSIGTVQITRTFVAAVQGKNANRGFVRPEQFSFTLPGMDRQNITRNMLDRKAPVRLQFAFDPRQEKVTVGANGDLLGVCQFRNEFPWQEVRKIIFGSDGWGNNSGKIAISNSWVAPWTGDLGKSPSPTPTGPQVFLANGDSSTGTLLAKDSSALVLTCDAGEIPLPPSRVHMVSWNATDKPDAAFPHRIRLMPRGQLSASTVRWEADKLVATTPWGEISLPMELVKELVWAKS